MQWRSNCRGSLPLDWEARILAAAGTSGGPALHRGLRGVSWSVLVQDQHAEIAVGQTRAQFSGGRVGLEAADTGNHRPVCGLGCIARKSDAFRAEAFAVGFGFRLFAGRKQL